MNSRKMPKLRIGELEAKIPIVQGGMSVGISLSGLASAVANEGGIGIIGAAGIGMLEPDFSTNFKEANKRALRKEIKKAKEMTNGIIGVNIMVALSDFDELSLVAVEEGADLVFLGAGLPLKNPKTLPLDKLRDVSTKVVPIVSSARAADIIFRYWAKNYNHVPDAVVVEGPLAGGHLGFKKEQINDPNYKLEKILPGVISVIKTFEQEFDKSEHVICDNALLWKLENQNHKMYHQLKKSSHSDFQEQLEQELRLWLYTVRNPHCEQSVKFCLQAYEERIKVLEQYRLLGKSQ